MAAKKTVVKRNRQAEARHLNDRLARLALAVEVYEAVLDATESFEVDNVGANLAYLMGAIVKGAPKGRNVVSLGADDEERVVFVKVLRECFPEADHAVWPYVELTANESTLSSRAKDCIIEGPHMTNVEEEGFCNHCGELTGQDWADALHEKGG